MNPREKKVVFESLRLANDTFTVKLQSVSTTWEKDILKFKYRKIKDISAHLKHTQPLKTNGWLLSHNHSTHDSSSALRDRSMFSIGSHKQKLLSDGLYNRDIIRRAMPSAAACLCFNQTHYTASHSWEDNDNDTNITELTIQSFRSISSLLASSWTTWA